MAARIVFGTWAIEWHNEVEDVGRTESVDLCPGKLHSVCLVESSFLFHLVYLDSGLWFWLIIYQDGGLPGFNVGRLGH